MTAMPWLGALLGALLALDHAACVSLLLSQPVVTAALFGAAAGNFSGAVAAGALVQLVWMVPLRVGGARVPETWVGGAAAAAAAPELAGGEWFAAATLGPAVAVGVGFALAAAPLASWQRRWQSARAERIVARVQHGDLAAAAAAHRTALVLHAVRGAFLGFVVVLAAPPLAAAAAKPLAGVVPAWFALPLAVVALARDSSGRRVPWWLAGAAAGAAWAFLGSRS